MNPNVKTDMVNLKTNLKLPIIVLLMLLGPLSWSQTNQYLEALGKSYKVKVINDWSDENDGVALSRDSDSRYYGVALPRFGMVYDHDYNKVNGVTEVLGIAFGQAVALKRLYNINDKELFKDSGQDLPFGLKIGMSREAVEAITGKLRTAKHREFETIDEAYITNLPGYRFLDITFWFENKILTYFKIETHRHGSGSYRRRLTELNHPMQMGIKEALTEKKITNIRLSYGSFSDGVKMLVKDEGITEAERQDPKVLSKSIRYAFGVDSVVVLSNNGYRAVWCPSRQKDKESFFDELVFYMNIVLDSGYRNDSYAAGLVSAYSSREINGFNHFFYHPDDNSRFISNNSHVMFHVYQVKNSNEVVLDIYEPGQRSQIEEPEYIGVCTPVDPDLALSDEDYLDKYNIELEPLKQRFSQHEGNALLRILGGGASYSAIGFETRNGYNEKTTGRWLKGIEFKFDKEFSRNVFKEALPLGFKRGMKISQIKDIFPDFEYSKTNAKKDWFTTYEWIKISEKVSLTITMSFRRGKLGRLVVELDEEGANSREWKILKAAILPTMNSEN